MKTNKLLLFLCLFIVGLLVVGHLAKRQVVAQTTSSQVTLREDFANGSFPPALNQLNFNHSFTLGTAWDLTGSTINEPLSQSPPYALTLYAGNEDRVTFNQPSSFSYVSEARVWGWTLPASESLPAGRGRVVFEGTGDSKTFFLYGGGAQWRLFEADATDVGDNGRILGEIIAVRLADVGNNGNRVMFDDLEVLSVTPPRRSNLTLTMTGSTTNVNIGDVITYDLTVTNSGPDTTGGTVTVNWPNLIFVTGVVPDNGITCSSNDRLTCTVDSLVAGQQKQIVVTVRTSISATGLLEATAQTFPTIDDPQLSNNSTRLRFVVGTPYTYTLIAEAGVGALADYDEVDGAVMNESGEVAFWAIRRNEDAQDDLAIFVGDGTTLTQRLIHTDLPALAHPLQYRRNICLSFNDSGWLSLLVRIYDPDLPDNDPDNGYIGNSLYLIAPNGNLVLLDSQSEAENGWNYHRYGPPVLNNSNRVLAFYNTPFISQPSGIIQFEAGQQTEIYQTNDRLSGIGLNNSGDYAFKEYTTGLLLNSYRLMINQQTGSGLFTRDILQHDSYLNAGPILDLNEWRQVPYSQKHVELTTASVYESFYLGGTQPIMRRLALGDSTDLGAYFIIDGG